MILYVPVATHGHSSSLLLSSKAQRNRAYGGTKFGTTPPKKGVTLSPSQKSDIIGFVIVNF
jgi:hypothetical protein